MNYYIPPSIPVLQSLLPIELKDFETLKIVPPKKGNKIAVIFDNFLRDRLMFTLVKSIFEHQPGAKIYIAEQGVHNKEKEIFYNFMTQAGHEVHYVGFDAGCSRSRNEAVKNVKEPFIFWCDCDELFTKETDLSKAVDILKANPDLGVVGLEEYLDGERLHYEMILDKHSRKISYKAVHDKGEKLLNEGKDFYYCDMVLNVCVARKEVFETVMWDDRMKLAEHLDLFMQLKYNSKWKVGMSSIKIHNQNVNIKSSIYDTFRSRNKYFWQYYKDKWEVDGIVGNDNKEWKIEVFPFPKQPKNSNPSIPATIRDIEMSQELNVLDQFTECIKGDYYLMDQTCLQYIKHRALESPLFVAYNVQNLDVKALARMGFTKEGNDYFKDGIKIKSLQNIPTNYKLGDAVGGKNYRVPKPVVRYLENRFGKPFDKL